MRKYSMTPNAIKKRKRSEDTVIHAGTDNERVTLCKRILFDNDIKIGTENITCSYCKRLLKKGRK